MFSTFFFARSAKFSRSRGVGRLHLHVLEERVEVGRAADEERRLALLRHLGVLRHPAEPVLRQVAVGVEPHQPEERAAVGAPAGVAVRPGPAPEPLLEHRVLDARGAAPLAEPAGEAAPHGLRDVLLGHLLEDRLPHYAMRRVGLRVAAHRAEARALAAVDAGERPADLAERLHLGALVSDLRGDARRARAERGHRLHELRADLLELLRTLDPGEPEPVVLDPEDPGHLPDEAELRLLLLRPEDVAAVLGAAAGDEHPVRPPLERLEDETGADPAGTENGDELRPAGDLRLLAEGPPARERHHPRIVVGHACFSSEAGVATASYSFRP
jgi:hypothetical protein